MPPSAFLESCLARESESKWQAGNLPRQQDFHEKYSLVLTFTDCNDKSQAIQAERNCNTTKAQNSDDFYLCDDGHFQGPGKYHRKHQNRNVGYSADD